MNPSALTDLVKVFFAVVIVAAGAAVGRDDLGSGRCRRRISVVALLCASATSVRRSSLS